MLLDSKKVGALLRCFALESRLVDNAVALALASIERMLSVSVQGRQFVSRVLILVPMDEAYTQKDCGETAGKLREAIKARGWNKSVLVHEVRHGGDMFVGILNYGMVKLLRSGCDYGIVLSKEAEAYFTSEAAEDLVSAVEAGAKVAGLAITELTESVMQGRITNTFAMWDLEALGQAGNFDFRNAAPRKEAQIKSVAEAWDSGKNFYTYNNAGVEEIIPLIQLVRMFGSCIAPILPRGGGVRIWKVPDRNVDPDGHLRHVNKLGTKFVRQSYFAVLLGIDPEMSFLKGGIIPAYRHPDYFN